MPQTKPLHRSPNPRLRLSLLFLVLVAASVAAPAADAGFSVDFDDDSSWTAGSTATGTARVNSYATDHVYNFQSGGNAMTFTGGPALRDTTADRGESGEGAFGTYAWRLQDGANASFNVNWTATYDDVAASVAEITGFGFAVRRWDASPDPDFDVSYSINANTATPMLTSVGTINNAFLDDSSAWKTFSHTFATPFSISNGDFHVTLSRTGTGERIMIDNFFVNTNSLQPIPEPSTWVLIGSVAAVGGWWHRRKSLRPRKDAAEQRPSHRAKVIHWIWAAIRNPRRCPDCC